MKKRNLKSLHLNKRSISHVQQKQVKGGLSFFPLTCTIGSVVSILTTCPDPDPDPVDPIDAGDTIRPPDSINICNDSYFCG